jgi:predicted NACHT family NTPase
LFLKNLVLEVPKAKSLLRSYLQNKCNRSGVPYLNKPIEINDIYVEVNILKEPTSSERLDDLEQLKIYDSKNDNFDRVGWRRRDEHLPGTEVAETYSKLMVLGKPGAGKSTFLQYLAIKCSDDEFLAECDSLITESR